MKKRTLVLGVAAALVAAGIVAVTRGGFWSPQGAIAQAPRQNAPRAVSVEVASAVKKRMPVRLEALGTVTPIASVAIKARLETEIVGVHFRDGAMVRQGDLLFTLDSRQIEAEIKRVEAVIAGAEAQLEQALRDVARYTELVARNATTLVTLNNAQTQVNISRATAESNKATLENLKVQLSFCHIRAPISGRASMANVKVGNFVRQADVAPLATIIQVAPVYVTFTVPQRSLQEIRQAVSEETGTVDAFVHGAAKPASGQITMIENSVDMATGMATIRATMPNSDEMLWPGTLVTTQVTLRVEDAVVLPSVAVQVSQTGTFVFVVKNDIATVRPVTVERAVAGESVISSGLEDGEMVVSDGHLLLTNGARVVVRERKAGT
ncbi:MAG: efflux RND transporter periplasmic adaptor subunit [Xanthobacteraceae bacterium]|jgi:RND family efflux transporter MFP subunit